MACIVVKTIVFLVPFVNDVQQHFLPCRRCKYQQSKWVDVVERFSALVGGFVVF